MNIRAFMAEGVCVERWKQYLLRFLLLLFAAPATAAVFELPRKSLIRVFVEGTALAVTMTLAYLWAERQH